MLGSRILLVDDERVFVDNIYLHRRWRYALYTASPGL